ncbi:MAG TPA: sugar porter family MFS transporter [Polyangiaceae bacterium]|nr:sugar porter family MFS transporter [Polyangiaceae bacterium]
MLGGLGRESLFGSPVWEKEDEGNMQAGAKSSIGYVILIASVAAIGGFLFGFDSGVINGTVSALQGAFGSSSVGTGFSVASMLLGSAVGAFVAGPLADRYGRKVMLFATAVGFIVSSLGSGYATSSLVFVLFRLIGGGAIGSASVLAPAYISEVAPAHVRGRLASLQQLAIVTGILLAFLSNYAIAQGAGSADSHFWLGQQAFRWMFWMGVLPAVALLLGVLAIPESPRYLVAKGKLAEAEAVFARIGGGVPSELVASVKASLDSDHAPSFRDLIDPATKRWFPLVWVGIGLSVLQQFVGINVVFYYGEVLWRSAGFSESEALLVNLVSGTVNLLSTFVAMALIDRLGRKPLLIAGSLGMTVTLGGLAICFAQGVLDAQGSLVLPSGVGLVALVLANLYVFSFGVSWGPVVWVLLGEMFPNQYRGAALSVGASAQWVANFVVTMTFPIFLGSLGLAASYAIYALFAGLSIVFVLRSIRETKGQTLEQM